MASHFYKTVDPEKQEAEEKPFVTPTYQPDPTGSTDIQRPYVKARSNSNPPVVMGQENEYYR